MLLDGFIDTLPPTAYGKKDIRQAAKELLAAGRTSAQATSFPHSICYRRTTKMLLVAVQEQSSLLRPVAHWGRLTQEEVYMDEHSPM